VLAASIIKAIVSVMVGAANTYETSVNFYQTTRRNNPEDSHLHTSRRENLKSHLKRVFILEYRNILLLLAKHLAIHMLTRKSRIRLQYTGW
jgi:hypothetical protein